MKCEVCLEREGKFLCDSCSRSLRAFEAHPKNRHLIAGTQWALIEWAANRARKFERARHRTKKPRPTRSDRHNPM